MARVEWAPLFRRGCASESGAPNLLPTVEGLSMREARLEVYKQAFMRLLESIYY